MPRKDSRTPAQQQAARRFEIVRATYENPDATPYDQRISELRAKKHRITTDDGYAALLEEKRDHFLMERDKAVLDKDFRATMYQHPTVRKLLALQAYYESDESVDAKLLDRVGEVIQQWTDPNASRVVADLWTTEVFETENKRRTAVEKQLDKESAEWNQRAAALRNSRMALDDAPDSSVAATDAPVSYEKNVKLQSTHPLAAAYELYMQLPADSPERAEVDFALDRKSIPGVIDGLLEKYRYVPAAETATDGDAIQENAERLIAADVEGGE